LIISSYPCGESYHAMAELFHSHLSRAMACIVDLDSDPNRIPKDPKDENDKILSKKHKVALQTLESLRDHISLHENFPRHKFSIFARGIQKFYTNFLFSRFPFYDEKRR